MRVRVCACVRACERRFRGANRLRRSISAYENSASDVDPARDCRRDLALLSESACLLREREKERGTADAEWRAFVVDVFAVFPAFCGHLLLLESALELLRGSSPVRTVRTRRL